MPGWFPGPISGLEGWREVAEGFSPKQRFKVVLTGLVVSDVFSTEFQKKVGQDYVKDGAANAYNVQIAVEGAPPIVLQLVTKERPNIGDTVDFPVTLEMFLKSKYTIRDSIVVKGPNKRAEKAGQVG